MLNSASVCSSRVILNLKEKYKVHVKKKKTKLLHFFLDFVRSSFNFKKVLYSHFFFPEGLNCMTSVITLYCILDRNWETFTFFGILINVSIICWQNPFVLSILYSDICSLIWYSWGIRIACTFNQARNTTF